MEIRQGDIHSDQHETVQGPFIEEIVMMASSDLEKLIGADPMGEGFRGTIKNP